MATGSRVCPECGRLNAADDKVCFSCGKRLPGPLEGSVLGVLADFSQDGLPGTKLMAGMCIIVFALCMASDLGSVQGVPGISGFSDWTLLRYGMLYGPLLSLEPWRLMSAVFMHGSILHIGMNMLSLVNLGRTLEPHFRSGRFLVLYLAAGAFGFACTWWWRGDGAISLGASGSVFGLLGAFIGALIVRRNPGWQRVFFSNLIMAFVLSYVARVDNAAHAGGFVMGLLLGLLFERERRPRKRDGIVAVLATAGVIVALASLVLSARSPVWKVRKQLEMQAAEEGARSRRDSE